MRIGFLIINLIVIVSINSYNYDYFLTSGSTQYLGTLNAGLSYSFYIEAKSGQSVEIEFKTSSSRIGNPSFTIYAYSKDQTDTDISQEFDFFVNGTTLYKKVELGYINQDTGSKFISFIIFEFTPVYSMSSTSVLATVTGTSYETAVNAIGATIIIIILLPIICSVTCIIIIICCCCKRSSPSIIYQNPSVQPLYPVNPGNQANQVNPVYPVNTPIQPSPGYIPPYP